jgi:hypothetical protein
MTLDEAARAFRRAEKTLAERRAALTEAIVEAAKDGKRPSEIVAVTGYTREHVRRLLREAGIQG